MTFGTRLKEERKRLRETQKTLAEKIGIHHTSLLSYEKDTVIPPCTFLEKLATLGFDIQYIITGSEATPRHTISPAERLYGAYKKAPKKIQKAVDALLAIDEIDEIDEMYEDFEHQKIA